MCRVQCYICGTVYSRQDKPKKFTCRFCGSHSYHYDLLQEVDAEDRRRNKEIRKAGFSALIFQNTSTSQEKDYQKLEFSK